MGLRERRFIAAVGRKGIGKSYQNVLTIKDYVVGDLSKGIKGQKVLILDTNDEYGVNGIRAISLKDVARFSQQEHVEARRIRPIKENAQPMSMNELQDALQEILLYYRGGMLLIEDMNKFTSDTMKQDLIGALCTNRHLGLDIVTSLQGIGRITPKMWQNLNWLRLHKVSESVEKHKNKFEDKYEYLCIAQKIVDKRYSNGDKRFFVNVDLDNERIYGPYSEKEFDDAALDYIYENHHSLVAPKLKRVEIGSDKKLFTTGTAIISEQERVRELYSKYTAKK